MTNKKNGLQNKKDQLIDDLIDDLHNKTDYRVMDNRRWKFLVSKECAWSDASGFETEDEFIEWAKKELKKIENDGEVIE